MTVTSTAVGTAGAVRQRLAASPRDLIPALTPLRVRHQRRPLAPVVMAPRLEPLLPRLLPRQPGLVLALQLPGQAVARVLLRLERLNVPDLLGVLVDAPVRAEEAHARHARDRLGDPLLLVAVRLVHERLRLNVAVEVVRHQVEITVVSNRRDHGREVLHVAKRALLNRLKHLGQIRVYTMRTVRVRVAEVLDVLGQVAKEEDVVLANLTRDFNLRTC